MGYSGGTAKDPDYQDLGDHSEAVQIDFDPTRISYRELLEFFWKSRDPAGSHSLRQYRQAIFYQDELQRKIAMETRDRLVSKTKEKIDVSVEPYSGFYLAEDYHQKHSLRAYPEIMRALGTMFPDTKSLINSTAAARINGYLGGYGSCGSLKEEIESFGLSQGTKERLTFIVCGHKASIACPVR